jgi:Asp-tRNA(Asn)/Glu-tRNA(Gln) amidotransferase A subunit family amidase
VPDGLPVGVQIVGPWLEDRTPLKLAELIEARIRRLRSAKDV